MGLPFCSFSLLLVEVVLTFSCTFFFLFFFFRLATLMVTNKAIKPQAEKHTKDAEEKMTENEGGLHVCQIYYFRELPNFPFFFFSPHPPELRTKKRNEHWSFLGKQAIKLTSFLQVIQQAAEKEREAGGKVTESLNQEKFSTGEAITRLRASITAIETQLAQLPVFEALEAIIRT